MKRLIFTSLAVTILAVPALAEEKTMDHDKMMDHGSMKHDQAMPGKTQANGVGVINSVDADNGMINITHEPMPDLRWPMMTMDLPVTKRVDLGSVKAGDKVDFKLKLGRDKKYRITEIEAAK